MNYKFCPNCGTRIPADSPFCPHCGAKQDRAQVQSNPGYGGNQAGNYGNQTPPNYGGSNDYGNYQQSRPNQGYAEMPPKRTMKQALKLFWQNYFNCEARSTRSEYWWLILDNLLIGIVCGCLFFLVIPLMALVIYGIASIIPCLTLFVRRARDVGVSNNWLIALTTINLIPILDIFSGIACLVISLMPSADRDVGYGYTQVQPRGHR